MSHQVTNDMNAEHFLQIITEFYCSLPHKKDMQNISSSIREFIFRRNDIGNKELAAKRILDFFLKAELKLMGKSERSWEKAFEIQTAKLRAIIKICSFPSHHILTSALNKIRSIGFDLDFGETTILQHNDNFTQILEMQIDQDIRVKTFYFFKWCQYLEGIKLMKELKKRQVENQKISTIFHQFGLKSKCFQQWKSNYKKSKAEHNKAKLIQRKTNECLLRRCLNAIQQSSEIISIQRQIQKKIKFKILQYRKRMVYKKLKYNQRRVQEKSSQNKKVNNWFYFEFIRHLTKDTKPKMNRSYQISRKRFEFDSNRNTLLKYFKIINDLYSRKKENILQVYKLRKANTINSWNRERIGGLNFVDKDQKLISYLSIRRKRLTMTLLRFYKIFKQSQSKMIQAPIDFSKSALSERSKVVVSDKKAREEKKNLLIERVIEKQKTNFYSWLHLHHQNLLKKISNKTCIKRLIIVRLTQRYRKKLEQIKKEDDQLYKIKQRSSWLSCIAAFKKWKKLKIYKKREEHSINSIHRCTKKLLTISFWNKLTVRSQQRNSIQRIINSSNYIILKLGFNKISADSVIINNRIQEMKESRNQKLKENLFKILVRNLDFNKSLARFIHKNFEKRCEKQLIQRLKALLKRKNLIQKVQSEVETNKVRSFYTNLQLIQGQSSQVKMKRQRVSKLIFIGYFRRSVENNNIMKYQLDNKIDRVCQEIRQRWIRSFFKVLLKRKEKNRQAVQKEERIREKRLAKKFTQIKRYLKVLKNKKSVIEKAKLVKLQRKQNSFSLFTLKFRYESVRQKINQKKIKQSLVQLRSLLEFQSKIEKNRTQYGRWLKQQRCKQLFSILAFEKRQMDHKRRQVSFLIQKKELKAVQSFFILLKARKQNVENYLRLITHQKQHFLSKLMAITLRQKFKRLKFNCSLKSYAKNLAKKAFKSLKISHLKTKQKQNIIKLDKSSSFVMSRSIEKSLKNQSLCEQIEKFNLRKSRQVR